MHLDITTDPEDDHHESFEVFKRTHDIGYVLAFSGGADDSTMFATSMAEILASNVSEEEAQNLVDQASSHMVRSVVEAVLKPLRGFRIAVQTGGTKWGVPKVATTVAKELGFTTIGIYPHAAICGKDRTLSADLLDLSICVHSSIGDSRWGNESPLFAHCLDGAIIIGGGAGTMVEVAHLLKINEARDMTLKKMIIPIIGTGGTADQVPSFPGKPQVMSTCLPSRPITGGAEASRFLRREVFKETYGDSYDVFPHNYDEGEI